MACVKWKVDGFLNVKLITIRSGVLDLLINNAFFQIHRIKNVIFDVLDKISLLKI